MDIALTFDCGGDTLPAVLHPGAEDAELGIVFVVGGPQYRVGSHRQFLRMARWLAGEGFPCLRFDYRGMGDADGDDRSFDSIDEDIDAAIRCLVSEVPAVQRVALLGLCDAASASFMFGSRHRRVERLIAINPWVRGRRNDPRAARRHVRHYYLPRLMSAAFWMKLVRREVSIPAFFRDVAGLMGSGSTDTANDSPETGPAFIDRMLAGCQRFEGHALIVLSERDLTAREFLDLRQDDRAWRDATGRRQWTLTEIAGADHTFSDEVHLNRLCKVIADWLPPRSDRR